MLERLSVDDACQGKFTCPSVWRDPADPEHLVIVGVPVAPGTVQLADGEIAVRVKTQVVRDAELG